MEEGDLAAPDAGKRDNAALNYSVDANPSDAEHFSIMEKHSKKLSQPRKPPALTEQSQASSELNQKVCRICLSDQPPQMVSNDPSLSHYRSGILLKQICKCKGSMKYVHEACLIKWLNTKNTKRCDLCLQDFDISYEFSSINEILSRAYQYAFYDKRRLLRGLLYALYLWIFSRRFMNMISGILKYIHKCISTTVNHIKSPETLKRLLGLLTFSASVKPEEASIPKKVKALVDGSRLVDAVNKLASMVSLKAIGNHMLGLIGFLYRVFIFV